ncbi:MAG: zinc-dependent metalloprotease [Planctomycetota bacterium]
MKRHLTAALALLLCAPFAVAEEKDKEKKKKKKPDFPPWSTVGKEMKLVGTKGNFWNVYQNSKKTKFWLGIPSSRINKPFLIATSVSGGTSRAGWMWNDWFMKLSRHDKKLVLVEPNAGYTGGDETTKAAVKRTYTDRVVTTYSIVAMGPNSDIIVDGTGVLASGATMWFGSLGRGNSSLAKYDVKNYPKNTEITVNMPGRSGRYIALHYSISQLPKTGYKPRKADDRIGYFTTVKKDFSSSNKDDRRKVRYVNRWNLQKRDAKLELSPPKKPIIFYIEKTVPVRLRRYVEQGILEWNKAFEKIGFYNAIEVEQQTADRYNELAPEDVRYNFFRWIVSERAFAMGPSRAHPVTGEILDADIIFDDDYIRYSLRQYKFLIRTVPASIIGPRGREFLKMHPLKRMQKFGMRLADDEFATAIPDDAPKPNMLPHMRRAFCSHGEGMRVQLDLAGLYFAGPKPEGDDTPKDKNAYPEEFIGQILKDTVMHEVGHTLGLRHNFKASIYRTLDEVNSDAKPADIAGSVMDYNATVIAGDGKPQGYYAMGTIGPYDYWAIEYGYTTKEKDLEKITSRVAEKGLDYATDEDTFLSNDPYVNRWDMGADPLNYAKERVALLKRLRKNIEDRAVEKGEAWYRLRRAIDGQIFGGERAGSYAVRFVGGEHMHRDHRGDPGARMPLVPTAAGKQRDALNWVCDEFLSGRYFDFSPELLRKLAPDFWGESAFSGFFFSFGGHSYPYLDNVLSAQIGLIWGLTDADRLGRVIDARLKTPAGDDVVTAPEVFDAIQAAIWGKTVEKSGRKSTNASPALSEMERNLQREYSVHLTDILLYGDYWYPSSVQTLVRHYMKRIIKTCDDSLAAGKEMDTYSVAHLEEVRDRLKAALAASYTRY